MARAPKVMIDAQGQSVPIAYVKPYDRERDRIAKRILKRWLDEHARIATLKAYTLSEIAKLQETGEGEYGTKVGGAKGNIQFSSFDGLTRIRLDARTMVEFDDRFLQAQSLILSYADELAGATGEQDIVAIIRAALTPASGGMLSKSRVVGLLRLNIKAKKWCMAMELLKECQFVKSGKTYVYVETRASAGDNWKMIPIDIAAIEPASDD